MITYLDSVVGQLLDKVRAAGLEENTIVIFTADNGPLIVGGVIYLVLWLYGVIVTQGSDANFVPLNTADDWLHFLLGVGMIGLGFVTTRDRRLAESPAT